MRPRLAVVAIGIVVVAALAWVALRVTRGKGPGGEAMREENAAAADSSSPPRLATSSTQRPEAAEDLPLGKTAPGGFGVICRVETEPGSKPVAGEMVRLRMDAPEATSFAPLAAVTDANGEVRFGPLAVPRLPRRLATVARLVVESASGEGASQRTWFRLSPRIGAAELSGSVDEYGTVAVDPSTTEDVRWLRVVLWKQVGIPIEGRVTTKDGAGIPGLLVRLGDDDGTAVCSDDEGRFRMLAAKEGKAVLSAVVPTWGSGGPRREEEVDVRAPGGVRGITWILPDVGTIAGTAVEADGRPAAGVEIGVTRAGEKIDYAVLMSSAMSVWPAPEFVLRRRTGADGRFRFVGTVAGRTYDVRWWRTQEEDAAGASAVAYDAANVEVRLDRRGVLPHLVDARDGREVYGVVRVKVGDEEWGDDRRGGFWPDQEGVLAPAGTRVVLLARARGYADATVEHVVSGAASLDPLTVPMEPSEENPEVRVRCIDADGRPLPWPLVRWTREPSGIGVSPVGREKDGAFVTDDLSPGVYVVEAWDGLGFSSSDRCTGLPMSGNLRYVPGGESRFEVMPTGTTRVVWRLPRGGALRLTFRQGEGPLVEPGDMRSVTARGAGGTEVSVRLFHRGRGGTWEDGTGVADVYESQALPEGPWDVTWHEHREGGPALATAKILVKAGETTAVDLAAPAGR